MDSEEEQEEFISRDEDRMSGEVEKPEILTIHDEEAVQKVEVKNEPMPSQFLSVQNKECGHTKWMDTHNIKNDDYTTMSQ